eukprot:2500725-Rhodomonas_salina.2
MAHAVSRPAAQEREVSARGKVGTRRDWDGERGREGGREEGREEGGKRVRRVCVHGCGRQ